MPFPSETLLPSDRLEPGPSPIIYHQADPLMPRVMPDVYGVDIALTATGDLAVNGAGSLATVGEVGVLAQALWLRLKTLPGELPMHADFGTTDPTGQKANPAGIAALIGSELARVPEQDPRFASVSIKTARTPDGTPTTLQLEVEVVAAGGTAFTISGLPEQPQIGEVVTPAGSEGALGAFGEELEYGSEEEAAVTPEPGSPEAVALTLGELEAEL